MTNNELMFERLDNAIAADIPGYASEVKEESKLMLRLNFFVQIFNKNFMTRYTTTIYPKVYFPRAKFDNAQSMWVTLTHEWVHLANAKRMHPVPYSFLYGLPHWGTLLALISLGAIWGGPWWLLNLGWLVCLAPLPAYFRAEEEFNGYVMSMATHYWRYGRVTDLTVAYIARNFYGPNYYFMWPFRKAVLRRLRAEVKKIEAGQYDYIHPYKEVKELVEQLWTRPQNLNLSPD